MVLQTLVEVLLTTEPENWSWRWALQITEAIPKLLAEVPDDGETRIQRARILMYLGYAHLIAGRGPGAELRELPLAVEAFRQAELLRRDAGQQKKAQDMATLAASASQLLERAKKRQGQPKSLEELMTWIEEEGDRQQRVERLEYLLTKAPIVGGTPDGRALYRVILAEYLLHELHATTYADTEIVIDSVQQALSELSEGASPELMAYAHQVLGIAYKRRMAGDHGENLEAAVTHLQRSLDVHPDQSQKERSERLLFLAEALKRKPHGDHGENIEQALSCARAALEARLNPRDPAGEANARLVLGDLYNARVKGRRSENSDRAIKELAHAAELLDPRKDRVAWGSVQHNLGVAYANRRWHGASEENLLRAIHHYRLSLSAHTRVNLPLDRGHLETGT
ncbi:hypothetical protein [Streptomyces canus]|uniref:hypothetical protein n=1 Tax=Streptomyces canus TaxID=58343 RepID=UPI0032487579